MERDLGKFQLRCTGRWASRKRLTRLAGFAAAGVISALGASACSGDPSAAEAEARASAVDGGSAWPAPFNTATNDTSARPCESYAVDNDEEILSREGAVEVNWAPVLDPAATPATVITVNINTGEFRLVDLDTVGGARVQTERLRGYALLGQHLERRSGNPLRTSRYSGEFCFDGPRGIVYERGSGLPRRTLTPPLITEFRVFLRTFEFVAISEAQWAPVDGFTMDYRKTEFAAAWWLVEGRNGEIVRSGSHSDYTIHHVPLSNLYSFRVPLMACANAVLGGATQAEIARVCDTHDRQAVDDGSWVRFSGGCVNFHPTLHWTTIADHFRAAQSQGRSIYVIQSYPGVDQRLLLKSPSYRDPIPLGNWSPGWYGP